MYCSKTQKKSQLTYLFPMSDMSINLISNLLSSDLLLEQSYFDFYVIIKFRFWQQLLLLATLMQPCYL